MASSLGLYIDKNIIKYAKVNKTGENVKIEAFGVKFYENLSEEIKRIVSETFSFKIPISINLSEETYKYFYMFNLLNKKDLTKAIATEFESFCYDKGLNKNTFEERFVLSSLIDDKDKIKVIHVSSNKTAIAESEALFVESKLSCITPIGTSIANVADINQKENIVIVNMEDKTTMTTILKGKIFSVETLKQGAGDILNNITLKVNSKSKAYDICRNTTIYTSSAKGLQENENEYLEDIMPTLYKIVENAKTIIASCGTRIDKIYVTGTLSVINNVDLYFQEFFDNEKCEVLKPYFITENIKINIKDFIEVNTAIGLAMQGLGSGIKTMNFKKAKLIDDISSKLSFETGGGKKNGGKSFSLGQSHIGLDKVEKNMTRFAVTVLVLILMFSGLSYYINDIANKTLLEIEEANTSITNEIQAIQSDTSEINRKSQEYLSLSSNLKEINDRLEDIETSKRRIPELLMQIMSVIPDGVQLLFIENYEDNKIVIKAQSQQYEQLGYFKAKLKEDGILEKDSVVSTEGQKEGAYVQIIIEGVIQ